LALLRGKTGLSDRGGTAERYATKVVVTLTDGTDLETSWDVSTPVEDLDAQESALRAKATTLIDPIQGAGAADALFAAVADLSSSDDLSRLLEAATPTRENTTQIG